jgi:hypothetical protein
MTEDTTEMREWRFKTEERANWFVKHALAIGMVVRRLPSDPKIIQMEMRYGIMGADIPIMIARAYEKGWEDCVKF